MFHGHFAAGLLLKAIYGPSIPACPAMMGSSFLDIIGGLDALLGLTVITPSSARGPYMYSTFTFIDWEHSALMMLIWSSIFGWATYGFGNYLSYVQTAGFWTAYIIPATIFSKILDGADIAAQEGKKEGKRGE
ncbi:hypothetical protein ACEPPN_010547 [Leptodophora sp. 'Broadleaf-Isolate-01']